MKIIASSVLAIILLSTTLAGWQTFAGPAITVIGGTYVIPRGAVLRGDLQAISTQIILEAGARVDGRITAVSSVLDIAGSVGGAVVAVQSDVILRQTAQLTDPPFHVTALPFIVLLPQMGRIGSAMQVAQ